jgi:hypothetical protein
LHTRVKFRRRFDDRVIQIIHLPAEGAQAILNTIRKRWPWVKHLFADAAYDRLKLMDKVAHLRFVIEIIRRRDNQKSPVTALGRSTHFRLDDPLAKARSRLRAPHRCLNRNDLRRHGRRPHPQKRSSLIFQTKTAYE